MSKRLSISLPEELARALENVAKANPSLRSKSRMIGEALELYLALKFPEFLEGDKTIKGSEVLRYIERTRKRAPSPVLRVEKLRLPKWRVIEG